MKHLNDVFADDDILIVVSVAVDQSVAERTIKLNAAVRLLVRHESCTLFARSVCPTAASRPNQQALYTIPVRAPCHSLPRLWRRSTADTKVISMMDGTVKKRSGIASDFRNMDILAPRLACRCSPQRPALDNAVCPSLPATSFLGRDSLSRADFLGRDLKLRKRGTSGKKSGAPRDRSTRRCLGITRASEPSRSSPVLKKSVRDVLTLRRESGMEW